MADLKLTEHNDLYIAQGNLAIVSNSEAIIQDLKIRLQFFKGEWILDTRLGIPYYTDILGQKFNESVIKNIFRKVILSTPGILTLNDLVVNFNSSTRFLSISFFADSINGQLVFREDFII